MPYALLMVAFLGAPPLHVSAVLRQGLPPYELADRLYRLEGEGGESLKVGDLVALKRPGSGQATGWLKVTVLGQGWALARLQEVGGTYPLIGDQVQGKDAPTLQLPQRPTLPAPQPADPPSASEPPEPAQAPPPIHSAPAPPEPPEPVSGLTVPPDLLEKLYFLRGQTEISPAGQERLRSWVAGQGTKGRWGVGLAAGQGEPLLQATRQQKVLEVLRQLGVTEIVTLRFPQEAREQYDHLYLFWWHP